MPKRKTGLPVEISYKTKGKSLISSVDYIISSADYVISSADYMISSVD